MKQQEPKIVFTGPPGAGKTTAIVAISDTPPVSTDVRNTDASLSKEYTTVGMDYGEFALEGGERVRLFGTPGQERFDFMWRILSENALGVIVLIDNSRPDPLGDLSVYLDGFSHLLSGTPYAVGVGRMAHHPSPSLDDYCDLMASRGIVAPVLGVDVREREDVLLLVDTLLAIAQARL